MVVLMMVPMMVLISSNDGNDSGQNDGSHDAHNCGSNNGSWWTIPNRVGLFDRNGCWSIFTHKWLGDHR